MSQQQDDQYAIAWIRQALNRPTVDPPDSSRLNGLGEVVETIRMAHEQGGPEAARQVLQDVISKHRPELAELVSRPPLIFPIHDLKGRQRSRWLIDDLLQERSLTVMYGASGTGKTFLALDIAQQVAQDGSVIYVITEGLDTFGERVEAWEQHHKRTSGKLAGIEQSLNLLTPDDVERLIIEAQQFHPKLIVFDTLAMCMAGGDENSAKDMGLFMQACRRIINELQTAVLLVHHTGKSGSSERGSSALRGNADMMIEIVDNDGVIAVRCDKSRNTAGFDTFYRRLLPIDLGDDRSSCIAIDSDRVIVTDSDLSDNQKKVIEWLAEVWDEGARTHDLMGAIDIAKGSFYRVLKTLKNRGLINRAGKYDPWLLTTKGKNIAQELGYDVPETLEADD